MVRQDTFIICVGVLLIILKLGQEVTQRALIVTVDGKFLGVVIGVSVTEQWMTKLKLNRRMIKFKIDTRADVTVIPSTTYDPYNDGSLHRTKTPLVGPGQNKLKVRGCFEATLEKGKDEMKETVYVVEGLQTPLAGIPTIRKLNLISEVNSVNKSKEDIVAQFSELFNRLRLIKGSYRIELEQVKPYSIMAPRRVPIPLVPKAKCELEKIEREGVILKSMSRLTGVQEWSLYQNQTIK